MGFFSQSFHRIDEDAICNGDDQINRIEVFLAVKATCQIGFRICRCMEVIAQGAAKAQRNSLVLSAGLHGRTLPSDSEK